MGSVDPSNSQQTGGSRVFAALQGFLVDRASFGNFVTESGLDGPDLIGNDLGVIDPQLELVVPAKSVDLSSDPGSNREPTSSTFTGRRGAARQTGRHFGLMTPTPGI
ncbi:MAG TPA: hypothetical protein VIQ11_23815 [Mycobacterium sp.]